MLERVVEFFLKMVPAHVMTVDPKDPLNVIRPNASYDDLGRRINGGWNENILAFCRSARQPHNAWSVNAEGELVYDVVLRSAIMAEFQARGHTITKKQVDLIMWNANGHSDYTAKLAHGCYELEVRLKTQQ